MPKKNAAQLRSELRDSILKEFMDYRFKLGDDPKKVAGNGFSFPCVDADGNEWYCKVVVSIPTGTHDGEAYDGNDEAENYERNCIRKAAEAEERRKEFEAKKKFQFEKAEAARKKKAEAKAEKEKAKAEKEATTEVTETIEKKEEE